MKPEKWTSADYLELSVIGRVCFDYLQTMCDDEGLIKANARSLRYTACNNIPDGRFDPAPYPEIETNLQVMERQRMILRYRFGVEDLVWVVNFLIHQNIDRPAHSILPRPPRGQVENVIAEMEYDGGCQLLNLVLERWGVDLNFSANIGEKRQQERERERETEGELPIPNVLEGEGDDRSRSSSVLTAPAELVPAQPAQPTYREGCRLFVEAVNEACKRDFDPDKQVRMTGKDAPLPWYTRRRKEGWTHHQICLAAKGAAKDPNRIENPQYQQPVSILRSSMWDTLVEWGSGKGQLPRNGNRIIKRMQEHEDVSVELREQAAQLRAQGR